MTKVELELDEPTLERLRSQARAEGVGLEEFIGALARAQAATGSPQDDEYRAMARRHLARYGSLFRRLAE